MHMLIPRRSRDVDVAWMEGVLADHLHGTRIKRVDTSRLGEPGQTSEALDIRVVYDRDDCALPSRYIAKLGSNDPNVLAMIDMFGQYRREVAFYNCFPDAGILKPRCFYGDCSESGREMVILLEHLAPACCPSWAPSLAEIELALDQLPAFHAKWWNAPELKQKDCLIRPDQQIFVDSFAAGAAAADEALSVHGDNARVPVACVVAAFEKIDRLQAYLAERPFTIVHADYHGKQMFMPSPQGGNFSIIDWQFPYVAEGAWDFARLLGTCLPSADWDSYGVRLLDAYFEGLRINGVTNYGREDLIDGIRMGLIFSAMIQCIAQVSTDTSILAKECEAMGVDWKDVWFTRHNHMMIDLGAEEFIRGI